MTLEEYIAHLNGLAFWKEFTFNQNQFMPQPGKELELADNLVWFGEYASVLQLKQRSNETDDPDIERTWFQKKVLGNATKQIRDTLRFLDEYDEIHIANARGDTFDIRSAELAEITKIVVFLGGRALPEDCWQMRHYQSRSAGFIHVLAAHDYLGILEKLRVPEDIRSYFAYREKVIPNLCEAGIVVDESDIMGAFVGDEEFPTPTSREFLYSFVQDLDAFDLSQLIGSLRDNIQRSEQPDDYYRIMLEFARVPRSVWREVKIRFMKSLEAAQKKEIAQPFRLTFPATDCTFMIATLIPEVDATGPTGEEIRVKGLLNFTYGAMYDAKSSKGVGILISKVGEYVQIDWSLLNETWKPNPEMDAMLANNNPFREAKEKMIDSFLHTTATKDS